MSDNSSLLLDLSEIDVGNSIITIEDTGNLLKSGALGLDVEIPDEDKLTKIPESVEEHEVPVVGEVVPGKLVCLVSNGEDGLNGDVHDHHALGTEVERKNLKGISDEETRETNVVEDTEDPNSGDLSITGTCVGVRDTTIRLFFCGRSSVFRVLVDTTSDGPEEETENHTGDSSKEERATSDLVDGEGSTNGDDQIENCLASRELKRKRPVSKVFIGCLGK
jgi:hypothetical protein